ncbi:MAG: hypothetical protein Q9179_004697 [Wetmoreana sp. 5 TL-2023]
MGGLPTNVKGKDLFDVRIWKDITSTSVFYTFIASLRKKIQQEVKQTTPTHRLIRTIRDNRKLVRCYTQNIDGLESRLGLCMDLERGQGSRSRFITKQRVAYNGAKSVPGGPMDGGCEVVPLHGDLAVLRCTLCQKTCGWEERGREAALIRGEAPQCFSCALLDQQRRDRGKRGTKIGNLRPNIVLYGEEHPAADAVGSITAYDLSLAPDVLLILGTSLHVKGVKTLVKEFAKCVHARPKAKGKVIFVNLSQPSESIWKDSIDYWVSMDCDEWVSALRRHRPDIWQIQTELKAHAIKKDVQRPPKTSAASNHKAVDSDDKENDIADICEISRISYQKSVTRSKRTALGEVKNNAAHQIEIEDSERESGEGPVEDVSSSQLLTPPSSGHKHSSRRQRQKQGRLLAGAEHLTTPTKRPRSRTLSEHKHTSLKRSRLLDDTEDRYPASKRKTLQIEIWEDRKPGPCVSTYELHNV